MNRFDGSHYPKLTHAIVLPSTICSGDTNARGECATQSGKTGIGSTVAWTTPVTVPPPLNIAIYRLPWGIYRATGAQGSWQASDENQWELWPMMNSVLQCKCSGRYGEDDDNYQHIPTTILIRQTNTPGHRSGLRTNMVS